MRIATVVVIGLLAAAPAAAATFDAGGWAVSARARGSGQTVNVRGSVKGPRCGLLRLDIFTHDAEGHRGHVIAQIKDVGTSPKYFRGSGHTWGRGGRTEVSSVYATCQG